MKPTTLPASAVSVCSTSTAAGNGTPVGSYSFTVAVMSGLSFGGRDVRGLDDVAPAIDLLVQEGLELLRRIADRVGALHAQLSGYLGRAQRLHGRVVQRRDDRRR